MTPWRTPTAYDEREMELREAVAMGMNIVLFSCSNANFPNEHLDARFREDCITVAMTEWRATP